MTQNTKILTPTDFSKDSERANRKAATLAKRDGAELIFVHVMEGTDAPLRQVMRHKSFPNLEDEIRKGVERELKELQERVAGTDIRSRVIVRSGVPSVEIGECAREEGVDLIVVGTHGHGAIRRFFLGSTTERLLRVAPCSVLLVREGDDGDSTTEG